MQRPDGSRHYPWYDSQWLSAYQAARGVLRRVAPARLPEFEAAMDVFRAPADFQVRLFEDVFDEATVARIQSATRSLNPAQLELHETRAFRRFVVHDHPLFTELQAQLVDRVSEAVGEAVEPCYNFLSLYGPQGVCPPHIDAPQAKWTLDYCISQSAPWPIHFGPIMPWPEPEAVGVDWEDAARREVARAGSSFALEPGQALVFGGCNQWHYRDPMPGNAADRFCDLLFFHFIPRGTGELIEPGNWARLFAVPELAPAVDAAVRTSGA